MELSAEGARQLMSLVYDKSYFGSPDHKDEFIKEVIEEFSSRENKAFRVFTVEELRAMPEGSIFEHSKRGRCWIVAKADGKKCVAFQEGGTLNLIQNGSPWDQPMRMIYSEKG